MIAPAVFSVVSALLFTSSVEVIQARDLPWRLEVTRHSFTASVSCKLRTDKASYARRVVTLHLGGRTNTIGALYRIDGGSLFHSADDRADVAKRGFALSSDNLNNPSGGLVRIPAERLQSAITVQVETRDNDKPILFRIDGLATLLGNAHSLGCDEASFR